MGARGRWKGSPSDPREGHTTGHVRRSRGYPGEPGAGGGTRGGSGGTGVVPGVLGGLAEVTEKGGELEELAYSALGKVAWTEVVHHFGYEVIL